ncbi:LLM class flavin-dependent oxidoreductase [Nonomuraea rosea]
MSSPCSGRIRGSRSAAPPPPPTPPEAPRPASTACGAIPGRHRPADRVGLGRGARGRARIQAAFRPIIAPTEELAWEKAHRTVEAISVRRAKGRQAPRGHQPEGPENTGAQRLIAIASRGESFDRALWTPTSAATGGEGNSNALVGTPETVAKALLLYYDLGWTSSPPGGTTWSATRSTSAGT